MSSAAKRSASAAPPSATSDSKLAIDGGTPVRAQLLPYAVPSIDDDDVAAVVEVLRSGWLTTGPRVTEFEQALAAATNAREAVAVSSGTAALHAAMHVLDIGPGDEVIVPCLTFAATANCVAFCGGRPVFADVDPNTLLATPETIRARKSPRTKAIVAVDFAGQPCDYDALGDLARSWGTPLVADACHSLGARYRGRAAGSLADLSAFSFHAVKHVAAGEGGAITTDNAEWARRLRRFRNHGIDADHRQRAAQGSWFYRMVELGCNYRLSDLQSALATRQLAKLPQSIARRREIVARFDQAFADLPAVRTLGRTADAEHAWHLYVVRLRSQTLRVDRAQVFQALRGEGIGVNVHYVPVHLHPYYQEQFGTAAGDCPAAEQAYEELLTLPLFPGMSDADVADCIMAVRKVLTAYSAETGISAVRHVGGAA